MHHSLNKHQLRQAIRRRRIALTSAQLFDAQAKLATHARSANRLMRTSRILSYSPFEGEISPDKLIRQLANKVVYYPKITNFRLKQMRFYSANNTCALNKYGIKEPSTTAKPSQANTFDVLLLPLVAFDRSGTRIGMGAGYYDRALKALVHQTSTKPYVVGLAHHFQEVKSLKREPWDIPLDAILTDHEFIPILA